MSKALILFAFFIFIFSFFAIAQWIVWRRARAWSRDAFGEKAQRVFKRSLIAYLIGGNTLFFSKYLISHVGWHENTIVTWISVYPGAIFFASIVLAVALILLIELARLGPALIRRFGRTRPPAAQPEPVMQEATPATVPAPVSRRHFLRSAGLAVGGMAIGMPVIAAASTSREYQINRIPLYFDNLPAGLDGLTIAQVSDFHSGIFMPERHMRDIFEIVNSLHPQIVGITGDFVDRADAEIPPVHRAISMLRTEYGVYGCLGNHDHFATGERVSAAMEDAGVTMLDNRHRTFNVNGEKFSMVGLDDAGGRYRSFSDMDAATRGLDPESFKVMLVHQPHMFAEASEAGMDLTLSGHTHGGQIGIELFGIEINPVHLIHQYAKGLYENGRHKLYVNAGVGMVGVPIRLVSPEITLFTLHSAG